MQEEEEEEKEQYEQRKKVTCTFDTFEEFSLILAGLRWASALTRCSHSLSPGFLND